MKFDQYSTSFVIRGHHKEHGEVYAIPGVGRYNFLYPGVCRKLGGFFSKKGEPISIWDASQFNYAAAVGAYSSILNRFKEYPEIETVDIIMVTW